MNTIKGVSFSPLIKRARYRCFPFLAAAIGWVMATSTQAQSFPTVVETIAALRALNATSFTNDKVVLVIDYYATSGTTEYGRGGGHFRWLTPPPSPAVDDGGHFIASTGNTNGVWERMLQGEVANVKMWGAVGDNVSDDTVSITNAINTCQSIWKIGELLFPRGNYRVTSTLVFDAEELHLKGENSRSQIHAPTNSNFDILRSKNAQLAITGGAYDYDHHMLIENLYIGYDATNTNNCCIVICRPGENHALRNLHLEDGGVGIRCLGGGGPGLKVRDCTIDGMAIAGISFEPIPGTNYGGGDPVSLTGVSGDMRNDKTAANACMILFSNVIMSAHITELKTEGDFGGGIIKYIYPPASWAGIGGGQNVIVENCSFDGGLCDAGSWFPCYFVNEVGGQGAAISLSGIDGFGLTGLINDQTIGRIVEADNDVFTGSAQQLCNLPLHYESQSTDPTYGEGTNSNSRLVVGQTALAYLYATNSNWFRVVVPLPNGLSRISGKLVISAIGGDSDEIEMDIDPGVGAPGAWLNVTRCPPLAAAPVITQARGYFYALGGGGHYAMVDILVGNPFAINPTHPKNTRLTLAWDINGNELYDNHIVQLLGQPVVATPVPAGAVSTTVNVYR